jgi:hypothetical protein
MISAGTWRRWHFIHNPTFFWVLWFWHLHIHALYGFVQNILKLIKGSRIHLAHNMILHLHFLFRIISCGLYNWNFGWSCRFVNKFTLIWHFLLTCEEKINLGIIQYVLCRWMAFQKQNFNQMS